MKNINKAIKLLSITALHRVFPTRAQVLRPVCLKADSQLYPWIAPVAEMSLKGFILSGCNDDIACFY